ncbi:MAG: Gfo/Idh/MocA family oxidoreductase [Chitinophagaceae bacterium]|nr:MAG: Gfo/Idh/MocA family oxidoreductase [Chitinophagaceae bacterium]
MNSKLRVGLIGYGKAAHMHAQALLNIPECILVGVQGRSLEKASAFGKVYSIVGFDDPGLMIRSLRLDVIVICTPHPYHRESAEVAFSHGVHVLIEKPIAASLEDADAIIAAAKSAGRKLGVVSQRRFLPPSLRVRDAIDSGKIGTPVLGTVFMLGWRDQSYYQSDPWRGKWATEGGGVLINQAPHQLDMLQWYMNSEIEEVYGVWRNFNHPYIEVEDSAVAIIRFKSGGVGNLVLSNSQKPGLYGKVHVHGSNGASVGVETDSGSMFIVGQTSIKVPPRNDIWTVPGEENLLSVWEEEDRKHFVTIDPVEYYMRLQDRDFIFAVAEGREPLITGEEGRKTVEIFTAIYRSQESGLPVKFPIT